MSSSSRAPIGNDEDLIIDICCRCASNLADFEADLEPLECEADSGQIRTKCARCARLRDNCYPVPESMYSTVNKAIRWRQVRLDDGTEEDPALARLCSDLVSCYKAYYTAEKAAGKTPQILWSERVARISSGTKANRHPVPAVLRRWLDIDIPEEGDEPNEDPFPTTSSRKKTTRSTRGGRKSDSGTSSGILSQAASESEQLARNIQGLGIRPYVDPPTTLWGQRQRKIAAREEDDQEAALRLAEQQRQERAARHEERVAQRAVAAAAEDSRRKGKSKVIGTSGRIDDDEEDEITEQNRRYFEQFENPEEMGMDEEDERRFRKERNYRKRHG